MRLSVMSILFDAQIYGIYESDEVCLILDFVPLLIWLTVWNFDELHKCKKNHAQGSCFGAEKPYGIGAWLLGPPRYLPFLNVFFSNLQSAAAGSKVEKHRGLMILRWVEHLGGVLWIGRYTMSGSWAYPSSRCSKSRSWCLFFGMSPLFWCVIRMLEAWG